MRIAPRGSFPTRVAVVLLVPLVLSCDSTAILDAPRALKLQPLASSEALRDAALFVGNLNPAAPTENAILRYDGSGTLIGRFSPGNCCMAFGPDEHLYVTRMMSVQRFNGVTGEFIDVAIPPVTGIIPFIPLLGPDGRLYVSDRGVGHAIRRYHGATLTVDPTFFVDGAEQGFGISDPQFYAFGPDGNLYVTSTATHRVLRFSGVNGDFINEFVSPNEGGLVSPSGIAFGPDGTLYVGSPSTDRVLRFDQAGEYIGDFFPAGSGGLDTPVGLTFGPDGDFYVASAGSPSTAAVIRYNGATGAFIEPFVGPGDGVTTGPRTVFFKSKIAMCHGPKGEAGKRHTINIGYLSAQNHVDHGDRVGPCGS